MGILLKLIGVRLGSSPSEKKLPLQPVGIPESNPFPAGRNRLLSFDSTLISLAASGNHDNFDRSLQIFHSELTVYNSDISRYLVREYKRRGVIASDRLDPVRAVAVHELFLEHNRAYIVISSLIRKLRDDAPLLSQSTLRIDDLNLLDESQKKVVFGSLLNIRISLSVMEDIWEKLVPYEQKIFI